MKRFGSNRQLVMLGVMAAFLGVEIAGAQSSERLSGRVKIDGSSTVAPITMAAAELFRAEQPRVQVTVGISGTGGGFKKFLEKRPDLRTDISDASRPIKSKEIKLASEVGVEFIEIPINHARTGRFMNFLSLPFYRRSTVIIVRWKGLYGS